MEREAELAVGNSGLDDFSYKDLRRECEVQTPDEMRGGAVSGGVRSGGRLLLLDVAVYLSPITLK